MTATAERETFFAELGPVPAVAFVGFDFVHRKEREICSTKEVRRLRSPRCSAVRRTRRPPAGWAALLARCESHA